jgi:hypothetical protein
VLLGNFGSHLKAGLSNFQTSGAVLVHWKSAVWAFVLVLLLVVLAVERTAPRGLPRLRYVLALGMSALAMLLGLLPFLHISTLARTQFFAAPGRAVLLACFLCLVGSLLGRRGAAVVAVCLGLLAANSAAEAIASQEHNRASAPRHFEGTARILRQIHAVSPNPSADTLILLLPDNPVHVHLDNHNSVYMTQRLLGAPVFLVGSATPLVSPVFQQDGVRIPREAYPPWQLPYPPKVGYDKVLAFRLTLDGSVLLLHRFPDRLLPPGSSATGYDPLTLLRAGPVEELPYFRYPRWADRLHDLCHMADGVMLGPGWGPLVPHEGKLSRRVTREAELIVNSLGQRCRGLRLEVQARQGQRLEALDRQGKIVATVNLQEGRQEVCLKVPTDPARASLVRVRARSDAGKTVSFRAFGSPGKLPRFPLPPEAPADIVIPEDLKLGRHWHDLESYPGQLFRWVDNDAEFVLEVPPFQGHLLVDVEPGPGLGGQPCRLTLRDEADRVLASACVHTRQELRLPLPANLIPGAVLRLHVEGGGGRVPNDPRIMNFRVLRCSCSAD